MVSEPYLMLDCPVQEAARHLRETAARFRSGRATAGDLDEAARAWLGVPKDASYRIARLNGEAAP